MVELGELIEPTGQAAGIDSVLPVYSVTKHRGFVPSLEYFNKQVFSRDLSSYTVVEPGEVAYATIHLDEGSIGISPARCLISPMYTAFKFNSNRVHGPFLLKYLRSPRALAEYPRLGRGSAERRRSISLERLGSLQIPLPPVPEQRRIADVLDRAEALRAKRRAALAQLDTLTQSIFLDMFGDPATNPKGWPVHELGDLGIWRAGGTPPRERTELFEGAIPWFSSGELDGISIVSSNESVSAEAIRTTSAKLVPKGSLMLGMYDTAALKASIAGIDCSCNQAVAFAEIDGTVAETVFVYFSILFGREHFRRLQRGVRQKNLNLSMVRAIGIPIPGRPVQKQFLARQDRIHSLRRSFEESLLKLDALFASLQYRAFRGEL